MAFYGGRPNKEDVTIPQTKSSMIAVIIHEVGHNYFPMIINNDERQWTWMDEGINSFLKYRTEVERYEKKNNPQTCRPVCNLIFQNHEYEVCDRNANSASGSLVLLLKP